MGEKKPILAAPDDIDPSHRYQIELHQEAILGAFAHNYWILRDLTTGNIAETLNGYATDVANNNKIRTAGSHEDTLIFRSDEAPTDHKTSEPIYVFGADLPTEEIVARWNTAVEAGKNFNDLKIPYQLTGGSDGRINKYDEDGRLIDTRLVRQANSNSAALAIGKSMGIPETDIRDAVERSRRFSPGFHRDLHLLYPDPSRPVFSPANDGFAPPQLRDLPVERRPLSGWDDRSGQNDPGNDTLHSRFATKLTAAGDPSGDILLKEPRDWTEGEMRNVMASPIYRRYDDPLGLYANDQVRAWHKIAYDTSEMKARGLEPMSPPEQPVQREDAASGLDAVAGYLAARAVTRGETGAVEDWQSGLNALERRYPDGTPFFLPSLAVDGDLGPRTRFATRQALSALGAERLFTLFS